MPDGKMGGLGGGALDVLGEGWALHKARRRDVFLNEQNLTNIKKNINRKD